MKKERLVEFLEKYVFFENIKIILLFLIMHKATEIII